MISRYSLPQFEKIWSVENKYETWLRVESRALKAMECSSIVPNGVSDECSRVLMDVNEIEKIELDTKHDFVAFLQYVESKMGHNGRWVHYGLTSSDIVDTAFSLNLISAGQEIKKLLDEVINTFIPLIKSFKLFPMIGRTHGMHAEPITVGLFLARHLAEFKRNRIRLDDAIRKISVGKLSGAVGTCAHFPPLVEKLALSALELHPAIGATQIIPRDIYVPYFTTLSLIAVAIERLALNIRHLHRNEVSEISEGFSHKQKGSSAMPHKKNPILCENLCGLSRYIRGMTNPVIENCILWHERDISHSSVERMVAPDITTLVGFMLDKTNGLIRELKINEKQTAMSCINSNIYGEYILLSLIRAGLSRKQAHNIVQRAVSSGNDILYMGVLNDPEIQQLMRDQKITAEQIKQYSSPNAFEHINGIIDEIINSA